MGITNLESFLHVQLINHIRKKLPGVKSKLEQRASFTEIKLKEIPGVGLPGRGGI